MCFDDIINLIKLSVVDAKFSFNNKYYKQKFGTSMGNCLSPVISNLYMEFFEKHLLPPILPANAQWFRYVDDVLCVWPVNSDVDEFLSNLNNLVPSIKFTMEKEHNNAIPFLDILINRNNRELTYNVYRKPTNNLSYVHYYSAHPLSVKISTFSAMFLRAYRICSPIFLNNELETIKFIANKHKYPHYIVDRARCRAYNTFTQTNIVNNRIEYGSNCLTLPFHNNFIHLPKLLKKFFNVNVIFKGAVTLKQYLISNAPRNNNACIYHIPCKDCELFYVGQTGKALQTRIKQHRYSIRTADQCNSLFVHLNSNNHCINFDDAKVLRYAKDFNDRHIIESTIISATFNNNINITPGFYSLDSYIKNSILKFLDIDIDNL